jgi:hypothetical protein
MYVPEGPLKTIHVDQAAIQENQTNGDQERPVLTVRCDGDEHLGHALEIDGPSSLVYNGKALQGNARVWLETTAAVHVS